MTIASVWSWVTYTVVMPTRRGAGGSRSASPRAGSRRDSRAARRAAGPRLDHERARERDALLLATRELARVAVLVAPRAARRGRISLPVASRGRRAPRALEAKAEGDVLRDRHVRPQRVALEHHAPCSAARAARPAWSTRDSDRRPRSRGLGLQKARQQPSVVVLPHPEGPSSATSSPGFTSSERFSTAATAP